MPHNHSPADGTSRLCLNEAILGHRVKSRWRGNGERACLGGSREPYWCVGWGLAKVRCPSRLGGRGASLDPPTSHNGFIPLPNPPSAATWAYILLFFANDRMSTLRLIQSRFCRVGKDCHQLTPNFAHDDKNCYTKVNVIINNFP